MYEIIQEELEEALRSLEENNIELFDSCLGNAHKFLQELMGTLDYQYEISFSLMSLYKYISKQIISARHSKKKEQLQECSKMIESLPDYLNEKEYEEHPEGICRFDLRKRKSF